ncbi:MAG: hypothetical protein ACU0CA_13480 [Paracoccaceae bacterium]
MILEIIAIYFATKAISKSRTPQGSVAWVVFLLAAPYVAVPVFLFLGESRFRGYVVARLENQQVISGVKEFVAQHSRGSDTRKVGLAAFEKIAEAPILTGNSIELLIDGEQTFDAIFEAIEKASSYVLIQFYIIHDDDLGRVFKEK